MPQGSRLGQKFLWHVLSSGMLTLMHSIGVRGHPLFRLLLQCLYHLRRMMLVKIPGVTLTVNVDVIR